MSFHMNQLNPQGNSSSSPPHHGGGATEADEIEYDRLRGLARAEAQKRGDYFSRSRAAYESGDRATAHTLSETGKSHGAAMDRYNAQARDYIFRANNAHQPADTIDLHGLYVEEALEVLGKRMGAAQARGEGRLCVVVGRGRHSEGNVAKIKPAVERMLTERGVRWEYEKGNEGMVVVSLGGDAAGGGQQSYQQGGRYQQQQQQYHQQQQQHPQQQQHSPPPQQQQGQQQQPNELEELAKKAVPMFLKKLQGCCIIM